MKRPAIFSLLLAISLLSLPLHAATFPDQRLIVKFKNTPIGFMDVLSLFGKLQTQEVRYFKSDPLLVTMRLSGKIDLDKAIAGLSRHPDIVYVEPNRTLRLFETLRTPKTSWGLSKMFPISTSESMPLWRSPDEEHFDEVVLTDPPVKEPAPLPLEPIADPQLRLSWGLRNMKAVEAWETTAGKEDIVVAVVDTGVDYNHEDLAFNMWRNPGEIPGNEIDDDQNGYVDDIVGWDTVDEDPLPYDTHSHGTHVAGIIGAIGGNGKGTSGVAQRLSIMAVKMIGASGEGTTIDAIEAVDYAISNGARIINMSWGDGENSQALYDMLAKGEEAGIVNVAAAGNTATDNDESPMYPAGYDLESIISVAATAFSDTLAFFSNYGNTTVDIGAPGFRIYSTIPNDKYAYMDGTSMAAPHVSGAAALLLSAYPE
ncbi:MAG: S8 family serine peptidase, partial [Deltaproteobacteria bacterium]|nr:S8 family serine peptidase [Deltaproteobacteria bacterium]